MTAITTSPHPVSSGQPRHQEQLWFEGHGSIERLCQFNLCLAQRPSPRTGKQNGPSHPAFVVGGQMEAVSIPAKSRNCIYTEYLEASFTEYPQPAKLRTRFSISNPWDLWKKMLRIDQNCPCFLQSAEGERQDRNIQRLRNRQTSQVLLPLCWWSSLAKAAKRPISKTSPCTDSLRMLLAL